LNKGEAHKSHNDLKDSIRACLKKDIEDPAIKLAYFAGKVVTNEDGTSSDETIDGFWKIVDGYTKHSEESDKLDHRFWGSRVFTSAAAVALCKDIVVITTLGRGKCSLTLYHHKLVLNDVGKYVGATCIKVIEKDILNYVDKNSLFLLLDESAPHYQSLVNKKNAFSELNRKTKKVVMEPAKRVPLKDLSNGKSLSFKASNVSASAQTTQR
jgi:hypothetical protein